jgi:hypothetical protein
MGFARVFFVVIRLPFCMTPAASANASTAGRMHARAGRRDWCHQPPRRDRPGAAAPRTVRPRAGIQAAVPVRSPQDNRHRHEQVEPPACRGVQERARTSNAASCTSAVVHCKMKRCATWLETLDDNNTSMNQQYLRNDARSTCLSLGNSADRSPALVVSTRSSLGCRSAAHPHSAPLPDCFLCVVVCA